MDKLKEINMVREQLTNEKLKCLFKNNFDLANYAIRLARYSIKSGHEVSIDDLLDEVRRHPNPQYLKDLEMSDMADQEEDNET
jgi:hypothetical protein